MIKTKKQGILFGIIMSYAMAYGMEVYNVAIKMGFNLQAGGFSNLTNIIFWEALKEALYMGAFVFLFSNLWGNRLGARFAVRHCDPTKDNAYLCQLFLQGGTVAIMCPTMSLVASILFSLILGGGAHCPAAGHLGGHRAEELPHGLFWNFFAAAPFSRWLFLKFFPANRPAPVR